MTDKARKLEGVKQEIRSVLLTYPNGIPLPALLKDYKSLVGQDLPVKEFGFSTHMDFLKYIPDVVYMNWSSRYNNYLLKAVADESTKHIEKLVSKQKTSKSASAAARRMQHTSTATTSMPPRFRSQTYNSRTNASRPHLPLSLKHEIYLVAQEFKNGLSLPNFLTAFRKKYGKDFNFKSYGFYTLEDGLNTVTEILLRNENGEMRVYPIIEKQPEESSPALYSDSWRRTTNTSNKCNNDNKENHPVNNTTVTDAKTSMPINKPAESKTMDVLDNFTSQDEHSDNFGISPALKEQFRQLMKENPNGIWVSNFPAALQKFCGHKLDHEKYGYYNLVDLFNDLPEIFRIEVMADCKDDWLLFDATRTIENFRSKESSDQNRSSGRKSYQENFGVIRNIRLLLQANCEGIFIDDFCDIYMANCDEELNVNALGFDSLPLFLETVADAVPLKIEFCGKKPKVYYQEEETSPSLSRNVDLHLELSPDIPPDAVVGYAEYELQKIPEDQKPDSFFPVYLSHIYDPSHFYIQLRRKDASLLLENLMDELERFYFYEKECASYRIPSHHIMSGTICAAQWPGDDRWHRIKIVSVPSNKSVVAFFVDYGTKERIPSHNLMFLKKQFMELPAQAIRSHLYRLLPYQGGTWDPRAKDCMLKSFGRMPVMAFVANKSVGAQSLPLVLCDVSGDKDIFLNDLLVSENLAEYERDEDDPGNHVSASHDPYLRTKEQTLPFNNQKPQVLPTPQAPLLPSSVPGNLLQLMSLINTPAVRNFDVQNANNPLLDMLQSITNGGNLGSLHPLLLRQLEQLGVNHNMLNKPATSSPTLPVAHNTVPNFSPSSIGTYGNGVPIIPQHVSHESDSEVFESDEEIDDDDNPEVNSISKRYVKRINLDDGYNHVHMIVIDDRPYMSSGDITFLLWSNDDPNYVRRKLKSKEISIPNHTVNEIGYEQLFYQLGRFQVKGVKTEVTGKSHITLFPFKNVIDILNIFGHPSVAVRDIIDEELLHFDPSDPFWKTLSEEEFEDNSASTEASNDKDPKGCLYELKASLQALKFRKQTLKNQLYISTSIPSLGDEIEKTEIQCAEVERRIRELQIKVVSHQRERRID